MAVVALRRTDHVQWGRPDSEEVIKHAEPTPLEALQPRTRPFLIHFKLQAITTQSKASGKCSGYNNPNVNTVYTKIKKAKGHKKEITVEVHSSLCIVTV